MSALNEIYDRYAHLPCVIESRAVESVIKMLGTAMSRKYECFTVELWRTSMRVFIAIVKRAIYAFTVHFASGTNQQSDTIVLEGFWDCVLDAVEDCLYSASSEPDSLAITDDERKGDNQLEIDLVTLLRDSLSPPEVARSTAEGGTQSIVPGSRVHRCIAVLQRGATDAARDQKSASQAATTTSGDERKESSWREGFAKACIDALLDPKVSRSPIAQSLAVQSLSDTCSSVLRTFLLDDRSRPETITEQRISEACVVLAALRDLANSGTSRQAVATLYPLLVDLIVVKSEQVRLQLREVLRIFTSSTTTSSPSPSSSISLQ